METQQIILLIINIIGGIAVIGSYIFGIKAQSGGANALWGGVPPNIRPVYGVSMVLSALGYFAFLYFILFEIIPDEVLIGGRFDFSVFYLIFIFILLPSSLWMPLTNVYIGNQITSIKIGVRAVLALVGLASIALVWAILSLETTTQNVPYWLAVAGSSYFAFHTAILDGVIWSVLFK
ncbi:MAG TPA: hypothetical protein G4O10_06775 [Dehalococcoidia bacterium]|nr:hypothetical protein [Dehalococcoidia bacterium]